MSSSLAQPVPLRTVLPEDEHYATACRCTQVRPRPAASAKAFPYPLSIPYFHCKCSAGNHNPFSQSSPSFFNLKYKDLENLRIISLYPKYGLYGTVILKVYIIKTLSFTFFIIMFSTTNKMLSFTPPFMSLPPI